MYVLTPLNNFFENYLNQCNIFQSNKRLYNKLAFFVFTNPYRNND